MRAERRRVADETLSELSRNGVIEGSTVLIAMAATIGTGVYFVRRQERIDFNDRVEAYTKDLLKPLTPRQKAPYLKEILDAKKIDDLYERSKALVDIRDRVKQLKPGDLPQAPSGRKSERGQETIQEILQRAQRRLNSANDRLGRLKERQ